MLQALPRIVNLILINNIAGAGTGNCVSCGSTAGIATCSTSGIPITCSTGYFLEVGSVIKFIHLLIKAFIV